MSGPNIGSAIDYLATGGVSEIASFTKMSRITGDAEVQIETEIAIALCMLAEEALRARNGAKPTGVARSAPLPSGDA